MSERDGGALRVELGCAGHLCVGYACRWHRHTQVGSYRVSSVGDYYYQDKRDTVGYGRFFETMVFRLNDRQEENNDGCGCREVESWDNIDFDGYNTAGEAQAGHERMVDKYQRLAESEARAGREEGSDAHE